LTQGYVDLRSDTVTRPTPEMRRAMAEAEVGDDVFREDPTVRLLEEETARVLGKEAALFVPTGSMGNEIAISIQTRRGDAILLDRFSHVAYAEAAAVLEMMGRRFHFADGDRGRLDARDVRSAVPGGKESAAPADGIAAPADGIALVEVENTHNWASGAVYPLARLEAVGRAARERTLPIHLDGARVWNASAATGVPPAAFAAAADTVMVCYSKGLGAPIGSAVAGAADVIGRARIARRMFGGGMRQVGIVAAGALHGLRHHRDRLVEDHRRARRLAEAIASTPGIRVDPAEVETNIVIAEVAARDRLPAFLHAAEAEGTRLMSFGGPGRFRAVTHLDVDDAAIDRAIAAIRRAAASELGAAA
jgi:threonine aldolase